MGECDLSWALKNVIGCSLEVVASVVKSGSIPESEAALEIGLGFTWNPVDSASLTMA